MKSFKSRNNKVNTPFQKSALAFGIGLVLGVCALTPVNPAFAQEAQQVETIYLDIPAQDLAGAFKAFSMSSHVQVSAQSRILEGKTSQAAQGKLTVLEALEMMLKGSGLVAKKVGNNSYVIVPENNEQSRGNRLEEVIVNGSYVVNEQLDTATGLGLTLQETPQSVSIVTAQRIQDQQLRSLGDVINNAPGISSKAFDSSRDGLSARGFDVTNYQIDGLPVSWDPAASAGETQTDTALYERVEVVRGATGLLTGAGDPSASINLVRKHADSKEFKGYISVGASRWDNYNASIDVSTPLNESGSVRGRTVLVYEQGDSYVDFESNKKHVSYAVVDADITDNTTISVGTSYQDNDPTASQWGGLPIFFSDGTRTDWSRSDTVGADWTYWASTHETYFMNLAHLFDNGWELKVNVNRTKSTSDMRLLYLYGSPDSVTGLGMGAFPARYDNESKQNDFGLRLSGNFSLFAREHDLVLGATHSEQDFIYNSRDALSGSAIGNFFAWDGSYAEPEWGPKTAYQKHVTTQIGYFAATRLDITDKTKVVLGSRVADWDREDGITNEEYGNSGVFVPYAGILYDVTDQHTLYASYTEIFQPQEERDIEDKFLDPVTGVNREVGLKSAFFDDVLHTTVTVFQTKQKNLAVEDESFVAPANDLSKKVYRAADGVESKGYEVEVVGELTPGWNVSANYTQFDATVSDAGGTSNTANTRFPSKLLRFYSTYTLDSFTFGGGANWEGGNYTDGITNPGSGEKVRVKQPSYYLANVMARYQVNDRFSAQMNINNLFDKEYYSQIGFYSHIAYGEPRNISVSFKYEL